MTPIANPDSDTSLRLRRTYPVSRERLFSAWTDPEQLKRWSAPKGVEVARAEVDLRVGGTYIITMRHSDGGTDTTTGTYREVSPPDKLVYTWRWDTPDSQETLVTVEFLPAGNGTELVLTHDLFPDSKARDSHRDGWSSILERLAEELPD